MKYRDPLKDPSWYQLDPTPASTKTPRWLLWPIIGFYGLVIFSATFGALGGF